VKPEPSDQALDAVVRTALKSQYHAALATLRQAVERCPDELWSRGPAPAFWQVAYHAAFYAHLYMQPNEAAFVPWQKHRAEYQFLTSLPWPPHRAPNIGEPYTREQVLEYLTLCDGMVDGAVEALDLTSAECGFGWYQMPKLEHQIMNIRHIQHHAAHLAARLRSAGVTEGGAWVGSIKLT
jgi:hypothetical protein